MTDHISINAERLSGILNEMRRSGISSALTTEIIKQYMGGFHSNKGVPVADSWNAQFGKYLKAHSDQFGICEVAANVRVTVDGNPTNASRWNLGD